MSFDKYINPKKINKVIDPGNGDAPGSIILKQETKQQSESIRDVVKTPISITIEDLIQESQAIQTYIYSVINDITEANKSDSGFMIYHQMVKDNHFNPTLLLQDSQLRPNLQHSQNAIKAAERDVYQRVVDPRAPFIQDLYDHVTDAGLAEYLLTEYWKQMVNPNGLYELFDMEHVAPKLALGKEAQHLRQIRDSADRIYRNKAQNLSYGFLKAFADKLSSQVYTTNPKDQIIQINKVLSLLKQLKAILLVVSIFNTESWEKFVSNLKDIYGDTLQSIAAKIAGTSAYSFIGGIQGQVFDFISTLENFIPIELNLQNIPEVSDFVFQINGCFGTFVSQIEDDLVYREGIQIKLEENRQLLLSNSQRQSKTKQFLHTVESAIQYLEEIKSLLSNINYELSLDTNLLAQKLALSVDGYIRSTSKDSPIVKSTVRRKGDNLNGYNA